MFKLSTLFANQKSRENSDDLQILNTWAEYTDDNKTMKYLIYEMRMEEPDGQVQYMYKAVKLLRIIRLPKSAKQSEAFMTMHSQILGGVWSQNINFLTLIANILNPKAIGLVFCYGVQGVASTLEQAKKKADLDFAALQGALQGTYRTLQFRTLTYDELEWIREKLFSMTNLIVVRGIPKAKDGGVDGGNEGIGGQNVNPDSEDTTEEFVAGMVDHEYIVQVLSTPVRKEHLERWLERSSKEMTRWNKQLQGTSGISFGLSIPMMYMANLGASQGWSHSYTDASTVATSTGETYSTSYGVSETSSLSKSFGEGLSKSIGKTITDSYSQSHSVSEGSSHTTGTSVTSTESWGSSKSIGDAISHGLSKSENLSHSDGNSYSDGFSNSESKSHSDSQGTSSSKSISDGTSHGTNSTKSTSTTTTQGTSSTTTNTKGTTNSSGWSRSNGGSRTHTTGTSNTTSYGDSNSDGYSDGYSDGRSDGSSRTNSTSTSDSSNATASLSHSKNNSTNTSDSFSSTNKTKWIKAFQGKPAEAVADFFNDSSASGSTSSGSSRGTNDGLSISAGTSHGTTNGNSTGTTHSDSHTDSHNDSHTHTSSTTDSFGNSTSDSSGTNWSNSTNGSTSNSNSTSISNGTSNSTSRGTSLSEGVSDTTSHSVSTSEGTSSSFSDSVGSSKGTTHSDSVTSSDSWGSASGITDSTSHTTSTSSSHSNSVGKSSSESFGQTSGESWGDSKGTSYGRSESDSYSQSVSNGTSQSWGKNTSVSNGTNYSESQGRSLGQALGITGTTSSGTSATMGLGPSLSYTKSYQWLDQEVKNILTLLEFQNNRLMKALRGNGAFFTDIYIGTMNETASAAAAILARTSWNNEESLICPLQVLDLEQGEQAHLLYHFAALSADNAKENLGGTMESYRYSTILLPDEFTAYTHLPRISEGGVFADVEDIPKFAVPSNLQGDIFIGNILSAERYSTTNGYETPFEYRLDESEIMHGIFTGESRSGKTVAAVRFISEATKIRRRETGKRFRIVCLDPKQDWRTLAKMVEPERFHFYSLGNPDFLPINLNICKVPKNVNPQTWIDGIIEIYCRNYGLLERGKSLLGETFYELYNEAGVFEDSPNWRDFVPERSKNVNMRAVYKRLLKHKVDLEDASKGKGKAGNEARDSYQRLVDRLMPFSRDFSLESRLFGRSDGIGVDELIGKDDIIVLESYGLETTFKNFIFGCITSGFFKYAQGHEKGFLAKDQYETIMVIEEANEVLCGADTAGGAQQMGFGGQSEFEKILDQAAGLGLFIISITQKIADMPSSVVANSGMVFAGKISRADDTQVVIRKIGREERIDNRDVLKWFPRSPIGWFVCRSSRNYNFLQVEPVLVHIAPVNVSPPTNEELTALLDKKKAMELLTS